MWDDPIVEEIRRARQEVVERFGDDIHAFFEYLREREASEKNPVVTLTPTQPDPEMIGVASR
jgi:hypothetical protein